MLAALLVVDVEAATATAGAGAEPALRLREAEAKVEAGGELGIILLCLPRVECKKRGRKMCRLFIFKSQPIN